MAPSIGFFLSAVLGLLSFPPLNLWPLAYVAMVPFLNSSVTVAPRVAMRWGYGAGIFFFGGLLYWIGLNSGTSPWMAWASAAAVVLILSTIWGLTAWAVSKCAKLSVTIAAALFVTLYLFLEVFWGTGEMGFPWAVWGLSQTAFLPAVQMAEVGDIWLVSFWVLALNGLFFLAWKATSRHRLLAGITIALMVLPSVWGYFRIRNFSFGESIPVAAVQGNTPMEEKWQKSAEEILEDYLNLSRSAADAGVRLIAWPETATPMPVRFRPWARHKLQSFADSTGVRLVTGATDYKDAGSAKMLPYNAAFLFRPGGREIETYAKMQLVPFGERIPGQKLFPFLGKIRLGQAEFLPGEKPVVFGADEALPPFACMICFEVLFPTVGKALIENRAALLLNLTEDGWYGNSSGPRQHLALTQLRAVATRRSIVRSVNSGISALIKPTGELVTTLGYHCVGVIRGEVPAQYQVTPAVRLARWWLPLYSVLLAIVLGWLFVDAVLRRRRKHGS